MDRNKLNKLLFVFMIGILIIFIFISKGSNTKNDINTSELNTSNNELNSLDTPSNESNSEDSQVINQSKKAVETFMKIYHPIGENQDTRFTGLEDVMTESQIQNIKSEIEMFKNLAPNGYERRNIKKMDVVDFKYDKNTQSVFCVGKVWSDCTDTLGNIIVSNELTSYNCILINEKGKWKIGEFSYEVI